MVEPSTTDRIVQQIQKNRVAIGAATGAGVTTGAVLLYTIMELFAGSGDFLLIVAATASLCATLSFGWATGYRVETPLDSVSLLANTTVFTLILVVNVSVADVLVNGLSLPGVREFVEIALMLVVFLYIPASVARDVYTRYSVGEAL